MKTRIQIIECDEPDRFIENERSPGKAEFDVGQSVLLGFVSKIIDAKGEPFAKPLKVRITARHKYNRDVYRGEVASIPDDRFFKARDLRLGMPVKFSKDNVLMAFQ